MYRFPRPFKKPHFSLGAADLEAKGRSDLLTELPGTMSGISIADFALLL